MKKNERQEILATMAHGAAALMHALHGVTDDMAVRVPGSGRWTILQCMEHVAVAEGDLLSLIDASTHVDTPLVNEKREATILARGADRSTRIESPKEGQPTGRFSTLAEAVQHFHASRERTIRFIEENDEDLRCRIATHPRLGTVNCFEVLLLMAVHPLRHAKQIEESTAAAAGPSSQPQ
jgi:uncharacterized damage-inducible protein DinB